MPYKPARPCRQSGCPALTKHSSRYCEKHRPKDTRISSTRRGYDSIWQEISKRYLQVHPICEAFYTDIYGNMQQCKNKAQHVDHKKGREYGDGWHNLQALCHGCHSKKTVKYDGGFGNVKR